MRRCLELASRGAGFVTPNPMVGAVLVLEGKIIGDGWHKKYGGAHAELEAIASVKEENKQLIKYATLFVNLEPCNHFGKTGPCTQLIIEHNIKKVLIGTADPNAMVQGGGINRLKDAGVEVIVGILEEECRLLNQFFYHFHENKLPFFTLKWAQSFDGFIAGLNNEPIRFTNHYSDVLVQKMRAAHQAIFVGGGTLLSDNPKLTNRSGIGNNPIRITFDTENNLSDQLNFFNDDAELILFNFMKEGREGQREYIKIKKEENVYLQMAKILFSKNIQSVLVEGGSKTINGFVEAGLWNIMKIFQSDKKQMQGIKAPQQAGRKIQFENILNDNLITRIP